MKDVYPISVIIPAFDEPIRVNRAIASVLDQTVSVEEIIVVDDCSKDPIGVEEFRNRANVAVIRRTENGGPAAARNTGVSAATSKYVAFLDADDYWHREKLERQYHFLLHQEAQSAAPIACSCGFNQYGRYASGTPSSHRRILPRPASSIREFAEGCWFSPGSTLLMNRSIYVEFGPYDETLRRCEDYEFFLRFAMGGGRLEVCQHILSTVETERKTSAGGLDTSLNRILNKHHPEVLETDPIASKRMKAYLHLEKAANSLNQRDYMRFATNIALSFMYKPRPTIQVNDFWKTMEF